MAATLVCGLGYGVATGGALVTDEIVNALLVVLPWLAGYWMRLATERRVAAEVEADRAARVAVNEECARISRDLHDSLAHALTLITLQGAPGNGWSNHSPTRSWARSSGPGERRWRNASSAWTAGLDH